MENYIPISFLNDFIFCPRSIYFHQLYANFKKEIYQKTPQIAGLAAHQTIESKSYSSKASVLQNFEVYCERYQIMGKIDVFNMATGVLTERKRSIKVIYDGYIFQVYAQYFALIEMGYTVKTIVIHDLVHNKNYPITLPEQDTIMFEKFEKLISEIQNFKLDSEFIPNINKCTNCIYNQLCDRSLC